MYEDLITAMVCPQQTRDGGPMLVRCWLDGGLKLNQHWVNISRGSVVRHGVLALCFHVVCYLMIAVVSTIIKLLCLLERFEPYL